MWSILSFWILIFTFLQSYQWNFIYLKPFHFKFERKRIRNFSNRELQKSICNQLLTCFVFQYSGNRGPAFDRRGPDGAGARRQGHPQRVEGRCDVAQGDEEKEGRLEDSKGRRRRRSRGRVKCGGQPRTQVIYMISFKPVSWHRLCFISHYSLLHFIDSKSWVLANMWINIGNGKFKYMAITRYEALQNSLCIF